MKPSPTPTERTPTEETPAAQPVQPWDAKDTRTRFADADPLQWQRLLAPYTTPNDGRAALDLATSVVPYLALSVGIYLALSVSVALRNPFVMFGVGPLVAMVIGPRIVAKGARPRMRRNVLLTNLALAVLVGGLCWLIGWRDYLLVAGPSALLAGSAGIWLFYVQHQFEDTYWVSREHWHYADAALRGSSYLKLPRVLQFLSGNIGFHHVHHLSARIPNYNLQRAHDNNPALHDVPTLSLWDGMRAVTLKLWDEDSRRLVTFAQARRLTAML